MLLFEKSPKQLLDINAAVFWAQFPNLKKYHNKNQRLHKSAEGQMFKPIK